MPAREIQAKTILRRQKKIDSWFLSRYGMNLYRGCQHNCVYCDGRAEKYNVTGVFGEDVDVKVNAVEVLQRELRNRQRRLQLDSGYVMMGGGVGDSYQPLERKYELTRKSLQVIKAFHLPVHLLTKSILVKRDFDIIDQINRNRKAIVSMSFSSVDERISKIFEPGVPAPRDRLEVLARFKDAGIATGMFLLPVIPCVTDSISQIEDVVVHARECGVDFIIFGGMTLKEGRQKEFFYETLQKEFPELVPMYQMVYRKDPWGMASDEYYQSLNETFYKIAHQQHMPIRIPLRLYQSVVNEQDLVIVILEHIDYILKTRGQKSPYGYAAYRISQVHEPLSSMRNHLRDIPGVGKVTEKIILEILNTGTSMYYEQLLLG